MPSPLDRPGLDDPPLREWVADAEDGETLGLGEAHAAGLQELTVPLSYAPGGEKTDDEIDDERPERDSEANPISVELVRGANGTDVDVDQWTVLIDGVRCSPVLRPDEDFTNLAGVYHLPLPFQDHFSIQGGSDSVRPVVFGVRVEAEALRPAEVELVVEQVVESSDDLNAATTGAWQAKTGRVAQEYATKLSTQKLPVYTPLDPTAPCVAATYPFRAPAQSALGILQIKATKRKEEFLKRLQDMGTDLIANMVLEKKKWDENAKLRDKVRLYDAAQLVARGVTFATAKASRKQAISTEGEKIEKRRTKGLAKIEALRDPREQAADEAQKRRDNINELYDTANKLGNLDLYALLKLDTDRRGKLKSLPEWERSRRVELTKDKVHRRTEVEDAYDNAVEKLEKRREREERRMFRPPLYIPEAPIVRGNFSSSGRRVPPASNLDANRCTVIGGGDKSAIDGLVEQFTHLTHALLQSKLKLRNRPAEGLTEVAYRSTLVNEMRTVLKEQNEEDAAHLLEALFSAKPTLLSYRQKQAAPWIAELDENYEKTTDAQYKTQFDATEHKFSFLLDRLFASDLQQSSVRTRFRIRVREPGMTEFYEVCLLEATKQNGFLAHAALSDANVAFERLRVLMDEFYQQLTQDTVDDRYVALQSCWSFFVAKAKMFPNAFANFARFGLEMLNLEAASQNRLDKAWDDTVAAARSGFVDLAKEAGSLSGVSDKFPGAKDAANLVEMGESFFKFWDTTREAERKLDFAKRNVSFFQFHDPMRYLLLRLSMPGASSVLSDWLDQAVDWSQADPNKGLFFTPDRVKRGFRTLQGTMSELKKVVAQSLPVAKYQSLAGKRGIALAVGATAATDEADKAADGAEAFLRKLRRAENARLAALRTERQLYCRLPHIVVPKEMPPPSLDASRQIWIDTALSTPLRNLSWWDKNKYNAAAGTLFFGTDILQFMSLEIGKFVGVLRDGPDRWRWLRSFGWDADNETNNAIFANAFFGLLSVAGLVYAGSFAAPAYAAYGLWAGGATVGATATAFLKATAVTTFVRSVCTQAVAYANSLREQFKTEDVNVEMGDLRTVDRVGKGAIQVANMILQHQRAVMREIKVTEEEYAKCIKKVRGNPLKMAFQNAAKTTRMIRERMSKGVDNGGVKGALALQGDGTRFRFYERFSVRRVDVAPVKSRLFQPTPALAWTRLHDGLALRFVPPSELTERVRVGEDLRRTAMNAAIARVAETGFAPRGQSGADLAKLSALRIHTELQLALRDEWLFPGSERERIPGGRHYVTRTAPATATMLAEHACELLQKAFVAKTPTLVGSDDVFFDCYPGGAAARFALRHIPMITEVQSNIFNTARAQKTLYRTRLSQFGPASSEWSEDRKEIVGALCKAWTQAAQGASRMLAPQLDMAGAAREALASFGRVAALAPPDDTAARLAAASAAAALYAAVGKGASAARREPALRALAFADGELDGFAYQAKLSMPSGPAPTPEEDKIAFAARRLDLDAMRAAPVGDGVDALVDALGPADLLGVDHETEHYYVAGGDNLDFQPSPLMYSGVVAQPVWLQRVVDACDQLSATLRDQAPLGDDDVPEGVAVVRRRPATEPGLARHPLVLTRRGQGDGEVVGIQVLSLSYTGVQFKGDDGEGVSKAATLLQALSFLCDASTPDEEQAALAASAIAKRRVTRARIFAFNVDRCAAGMTLAASAPETEVEAAQVFPTISEVAVALGIARSSSDQVRLRVPDAEAARHHLSQLRARCADAVARGCKAVTLAELAVSVVDLEDASGRP